MKTNYTIASCILVNDTLVKERDGVIVSAVNSSAEENSTMNWAYSGEGSSTLAIMLLKDVLGENTEDTSYWSDAYDALMAYITGYPQDRKFVITEDEIYDMLPKHSVKECLLLNMNSHIDSINDYCRTNMLRTPKSLHTILRIELPYVISFTKEGIEFQNRDYMQLGVFKNSNNDVDTLVIKPNAYINDDSLKSELFGLDNMRYLYNDSSAPWNSASNLRDYVHELNNVLGVLGLNKIVIP